MVRSFLKASLIFVIMSFLLSCENDDNSMPNVTYELGQVHEGGVIFYIDETGQHGLISSTIDQDDAPWACSQLDFSGALAVEIGSGQQNTLDILNGVNQSVDCNPVSYAAKLCDELELNGYTDWYLPSYNELEEMLVNRELIGDFKEIFYWSSSQYNYQWARIKYFGFHPDGIPINNSGKDSNWSVRAIRSF